jgi:VanZ family protein
MLRSKTTAAPLTLLYVALIAYASLYPFDDWRNQQIVPWTFLWQPWPLYWSTDDAVMNFLGYLPLGLGLTWVQYRRAQQGVRWPSLWLLAVMLSLFMESLQTYLPSRVPSIMDFVLNVLGAMAGAAVCMAMNRWGWIQGWRRYRERWLVPDSVWLMVSLFLWPFALLFPAGAPFVTGHMLSRIHQRVEPFIPMGLWQSINNGSFLSMSTSWRESISFFSSLSGLLIPCLLSNAIVIKSPKRHAVLVFLMGVAIGAMVVSTTLTFGWAHMGSWVNAKVLASLMLAWGLAHALATLSTRVNQWILLGVLVVHIALANSFDQDVYLAQTLQTWEQGRYVRFNGLAQWVGWLWPYGVSVLMMVQLLTPLKNAQPQGIHPS